MKLYKNKQDMWCIDITIGGRRIRHTVSKYKEEAKMVMHDLLNKLEYDLARRTIKKSQVDKL